MNEEELFCKLFPEYVVNGKPLSPYFDLFESGYEQAENRFAELKAFKEKCKFNVSDIFKDIETEKQLTKAKEIIKNLMVFAEMDDREYEEEYKEAEQFLSEVEK